MRHPTRATGAYAVVTAVLATAFAIGILGGPYRAVERSDYMTYQTAGRIVLGGRGACLYTLACQVRAQHELIGEEPTFERGVLPFTSPPWLGALVSPLAALALWPAFALFTLLSVLLLAFAVWRLAWGGAGTRLVAVVLMLSAWPTTMAVIRGQSTLAVAALVGLSASASLSGRGSWTGALAGLAVMKPTLVPLWLARLVVEGRWRAILAASLVVAALAVLAVVIVSPRAVADYPAYLLGLAGTTESPGIHVEEMINWRGATLRLGGSDLITLVGVALTLAAVALAWWWARRSPRASALGAAIAFVATPLVIPHANQHELVLASLGLLLAITAISELRVPLVMGVIGFHAVLWAGPLLSGAASGWLIFIGLVIWLVVLLALSWREGRRYFSSVLVRRGTD
jgi:hypothetical protein